MWIEAVLLTEDLDGLVAQMAPIEIALDAGHLHLSDPGPCVLVPDVGLRIVCQGKAHWPVLGIEVPVTIRSLTVLLRPEIDSRGSSEEFVVRLEIENVDLAGVPKLFEHRITELANKELVRKRVELSWGFARWLTRSLRLPESIAPLESLDLTVMAGRVRILSDGIGLAVRFGAAVKRQGDGLHVGEGSLPRTWVLPGS